MGYNGRTFCGFPVARGHSGLTLKCSVGGDGEHGLFRVGKLQYDGKAELWWLFINPDCFKSGTILRIT
jgi:hypothetical protein